MLAVLDRGERFSDPCRRAYPRGRRIISEIDAWFRASTDGVFDFETIFHATGLDPDFIHKGLRSSCGLEAVGTRRSA